MYPENVEKNIWRGNIMSAVSCLKLSFYFKLHFISVNVYMWCVYMCLVHVYICAVCTCVRCMCTVVCTHVCGACAYAWCVHMLHMSMYTVVCMHVYSTCAPVCSWRPESGVNFPLYFRVYIFYGTLFCLWIFFVSCTYLMCVETRREHQTLWNCLWTVISRHERGSTMLEIAYIL